jgi:hypothetical protein
VAQVVEHFPRKGKALSSDLPPPEKEKKQKGKTSSSKYLLCADYVSSKYKYNWPSKCVDVTPADPINCGSSMYIYLYTDFILNHYSMSSMVDDCLHGICIVWGNK